MNIGLFFGSFNPIHTGHLIIANHILNDTDIEKIWFVISPQNPLKNPKSLLNENYRLHLVRLAVENDNRLKASDIEFHLPNPSYTIDTLIYLEEKFHDHRFHIIMGGDSFTNIKKWKNHEQLVNSYPILVYNRSGFAPADELSEKVKFLNAPLLNISATEIRELIKRKKSIRYLVPESVREEIEIRKFYL